MLVLGIETSCDETGIALYDGRQRKLLANYLYSQATLHASYGGVVPELASRDHLRKIVPLLERTLAKAGVSVQELDVIAYTGGPGLVGALMVGAGFASALGFSLGIPVLAINHLEGHLLAPFLDSSAITFPFLALLVSGGHTQLIEAKALGDYRLLGETLDDAVGEAFDKVAKVLDLPYPGGAKLAQLALQGDSGRFTFPRPMINRHTLDFSFSGLKTYALNCYRNYRAEANIRANVATAFQEAATEVIVSKCRQAIRRFNFKTLVVAGGVSANLVLREKIATLGRELVIQVYYPSLAYCTDNGAMIAYAGWLHYNAGVVPAPALQVNPHWPL